MKTFCRLLILVTALNGSTALQAADPAPVSSPENKQDETWFNKQAQIFYGNHIEYIKKLQAEKKSVQQKIKALKANKAAASDPASKQKIDEQIKAQEEKLAELNENAAKHDLDTAEFGLIAAQRRLEIAKKNLSKIQEQRKKS